MLAPFKWSRHITWKNCDHHLMMFSTLGRRFGFNTIVINISITKLNGQLQKTANKLNGLAVDGLCPYVFITLKLLTIAAVFCVRIDKQK